MGFGRLARLYQPLERMTFGPWLQRARLEHLGCAAGAGEVLLVGDGDGRFLEALLIERAARGRVGRVTSVDASRRMLQRARERCAGLPGADRVAFSPGRVESLAPPAGQRADAIVSHFFLDCFDERELPPAVAAVTRFASPDARWVIADFSVPVEGDARRVLARALRWTMYRFFAAATGLRARRLPDFHNALTGSGWRQESRKPLLGGFLFSAVWRRDPGGQVLSSLEPDTPDATL